MPWEETSVLESKIGFVMERLRGEESFAELCRRHGISRQAGYALMARFEAEGAGAFEERSRAPRRHANAISDAVAAAVLEVRREHPTWGPKKIRALLLARRPELICPAESTIGVMLSRHGLSVARRRRRRAPAGASPLTACMNPNDVWGIDFKGWFRTGDGARCDPFSLSDLTSRYVLRLQVIEKLDTAHVWPIIETAFREFGLPGVIRSDNGPPFASVGAGGLSRLAVRLIKLGVTPERIAPGKPQQNGRHERLHRTLREDTANPPAASLRAQQRRFEAFRREFNQERPHEALGQVTPASVYQPRTRAYTGRLREPEYGADHIVRRVRQSGEIKWRGGRLFISQALVGEPVGVTEIDDGHWQVSFGPVLLGAIDPNGKFHSPWPKPSPAKSRNAPPPGGETVNHVPG